MTHRTYLASLLPLATTRRSVEPAMRSLCKLAMTGLALTTLAVSQSAAADPGLAWNRFRGQDGMASLPECSVPLPWSEQDVAWTIDVPGIGHGSPAVYGNRVYLMSADSMTAERFVLAYDLQTGKQIWSKAYPSKPYHLHARSSFASCTPSVTKDAVFVTWGTPENVVLKAFTHDGQEIWSRDLGPFVSQHGYGASPVVYQDKLILFNSQQAEELKPGEAPGISRITAFDPTTGDTLWETTLNATRVCYGLPSLFQDDSGDAALLFSNTGNGLFAVRLADGDILWNKPVFSKRCVSSPIVVGGLGIGTEGSGGGGNILFAVDLSGDHEIKFKIDRSAPYVPTPVTKGKLMFLWEDKGIVSCIRLPAGDVVWSKRIGGNVSTSPVVAGDKLVGIAEDGTVTILAAAEKFHEFGKVKLDETTRATPALGKNFMLVRTASRLICVGDPSAE